MTTLQKTTSHLRWFMEILVLVVVEADVTTTKGFLMNAISSSNVLCNVFFN